MRLQREQKLLDACGFAGGARRRTNLHHRALLGVLLRAVVKQLGARLEHARVDVHGDMNVAVEAILDDHLMLVLLDPAGLHGASVLALSAGFDSAPD